jgi:hypothetical protein
VTAWPAALLALAAVVVLLTLVRARRRAAAREARRVEALGGLAERVESALAQLRHARPPPVAPPASGAPATVPLIAGVLPGRAAFVDAVVGALDAESGGGRLTVAVTRVAGETTLEALAGGVRGVTGQEAYAVGPTAVAFVLPGTGRAAGLGALARIESLVASSGRAIERGPGESGAELVARLLEPPAAPGAEARSGPVSGPDRGP